MWTFFGLSHEYMESLYEQFFLMKYYGNWSLAEMYSLPIGLRNWFFERFAKQKEEENKSSEDSLHPQSK